MHTVTRWTLAAVLSLAISSAVGAWCQTLEWARRYHGPADSNEVGEDVAVAVDGSVYVTGYAETAGRSYDLLLQKYAPGGARVWSRTFHCAGDEYGADIDLGSDGSLYVAGTAILPQVGGRVLLQRYTQSGDLLWTRLAGGAGRAGGGGSRSIAVGPGDAVYVTGSVLASEGTSDLFLQRYDSRGTLLWTRVYGRAGVVGEDEGTAVAVGMDGSVYVAGRTELSGTVHKVLVEKHSPNGELLWRRTWQQRPGASTDIPEGLAIGLDGGIYVTGRSDSSFFLQRYSPNGAILWTRFEPFPEGGSVGRAVAVGPTGGVFAVGSLFVWGEHAYLDSSVEKRSPGGGLYWRTSYLAGAGGQSEPRGVAVGPDESVYVVGYDRWNKTSGNLLLLKYR